MKTKHILTFILAILILTGIHWWQANAQTSNFWFPQSNQLRPVVNSWGVSASGTITFRALTNCNTIDTSATGTLVCGADATGVGGTTTTISVQGVTIDGPNFTFASSGIIAITGSGTTLTFTVSSSSLNLDTFLVSSTFWGFTPNGDLGGTWDLPSVDDDSHAHTATTISGLSTADFTSANLSLWTNDLFWVQSSSLSAYSTSTGANPTASADTTAVNGTANTFMRSDASPALNTKFASSSMTFNLYDATTTAPYSYAKWRTEIARTITEISCDEYAAATSTWELYRATGLGSEANASMILGSISCGISGTTSNTFTTSSLNTGDFLFAHATGTFGGTPTWTALNVYFRK